MKALLYMATGVPAIAAAIGTNCDVIRHGENGLLAHTPEEWLAAIDRLAQDPVERARLGAAGRRTVEDRYSKRVCGLQLAEVVRSVVG